MTDRNRVTNPAATWTCWPDPAPGWLLPHGTGISVQLCTEGSSIWLMLWSLITALHCSNGSWSKTRSWWREKGQGKHTVWKPEGCPEPRFAQRARLENPSR